MKQEILNRIKELGGNIDQVKGKSLEKDLCAINFGTVLYIDAAAGIIDEHIDKFIKINKNFFDKDTETFYAKFLDRFFYMPEGGWNEDWDEREHWGETVWLGELWTPFKTGTDDFKNWNDHFDGMEEPDLEEIRKVIEDPTPDFIRILYSFCSPDNYYICPSDPKSENPTVFSTCNYDVFFDELVNENSLEDFLKRFLTKNELIEYVKKQLITIQK